MILGILDQLTPTTQKTYIIVPQYEPINIWVTRRGHMKWMSKTFHACILMSFYELLYQMLLVDSCLLSDMNFDPQVDKHNFHPLVFLCQLSYTFQTNIIFYLCNRCTFSKGLDSVLSHETYYELLFPLKISMFLFKNPLSTSTWIILTIFQEHYFSLSISLGLYRSTILSILFSFCLLQLQRKHLLISFI